VTHLCVFTIPGLFTDFQLIRAQVLFIPEQIYSEAVYQQYFCQVCKLDDGLCYVLFSFVPAVTVLYCTERVPV